MIVTSSVKINSETFRGTFGRTIDVEHPASR